MKIDVDGTKCQAYGVCAEVAPELFTMDEFGYAAAAGDGTVPEDRTDAARQAFAECPAAAVRQLK